MVDGMDGPPEVSMRQIQADGESGKTVTGTVLPYHERA